MYNFCKFKKIVCFNLFEKEVLLKKKLNVNKGKTKKNLEKVSKVKKLKAKQIPMIQQNVIQVDTKRKNC